MKDISFVRTEDAPVSAPPSSTIGPVAWMREHLFSSISNTILTLIGVYLIYLVVPPLLNFAIFDAVYSGTDREACLAEGGGHVGACWPYVEAKFNQFIYGRYPAEERWRVDLVFAGFLIGLIPLLIPSVPYKRENAIYMFGLYPLAALVLLTGGAFEYGSFLIAGLFTSGLTAFVIDFVLLFGVIAGIVGYLAVSSEKDPMPGVIRGRHRRRRRCGDLHRRRGRLRADSRRDGSVGRSAGDAGGCDRRHRRVLPDRRRAGARPAFEHADRQIFLDHLH